MKIEIQLTEAEQKEAIEQYLKEKIGVKSTFSLEEFYPALNKYVIETDGGEER